MNNTIADAITFAEAILASAIDTETMGQVYCIGPKAEVIFHDDLVDKYGYVHFPLRCRVVPRGERYILFSGTSHYVYAIHRIEGDYISNDALQECNAKILYEGFVFIMGIEPQEEVLIVAVPAGTPLVTGDGYEYMYESPVKKLNI